ncbi:unnamed protein product [Rotaria sp. Silwood2]|nr:unnamed protein product [Rotaria sp. Silwood2]CAF3166473.1 unnamed protein product [Rotaria sp. Silwood2]CAF4081927.1 unnamed protein product [Rotaria sp. Silwood2]
MEYVDNAKNKVSNLCRKQYQHNRQVIKQIEESLTNYDKNQATECNLSLVASQLICVGSQDDPTVIVTISIDNYICNQPFAILESLSQFTEEEEILFSTGAIFQIKNVK